MLESMFYVNDPSEGRSQPRKVYIEPTSLCNLRCSICFRHGWYDEGMGHMSMDVFARLSRQTADMENVEEIFFGGMGEPLFHPRIGEMVAALPRDKKISLLTNGTLLTGEMSRLLIGSGLSRLWISMDGFDKASYESIQLGSRYDLILENLRLFNEARAGTDVRLGITFVITPENIGQLEKIDAFADAIGADELNISHMIPSGPVRAEDMIYDLPGVPVGKMRRICEGWEEHPEHVCPFIRQNAVFVRWDGQVAPCMQLLHNCYTWLYEEKRKITRFQYGDVAEKHLFDCWNDPDYAAFRKRVETFYFPFCTICWGCDDRKENLTDCFYGESPTCGACLWATGKVFCP